MESLTRTERNPNIYFCVTEWGFTPITWPEFVKQFPEQAKSYSEICVEHCSEDDLLEMGSENPLEWTHLWDDEVFLNKENRPLILGNITGPGGSLWLAYEEGGWDEILLNDEDGSIEED